MSGERSATSSALAVGLPDDDPLAPPPRLGLDVPDPKPLDAADEAAHSWAPILRSAAVHESPAVASRITGRVPALTPESTQNIVQIEGETRRDGALWVPIRAAEARGWVPRSALGGYTVSEVRLLVDTDAYTATLVRRDRIVFRARVGVGTAGAPTPTGSFYVRNRLTRYRSAFYGPVAFGTSARSTLTDWPAGGFVGIHGTSRPELLPGRVSHGCIRMRNADILELARLMPVGTPVEIT